MLEKELELSEPAKSLKPGIYKHYKGGEYDVLGVARHKKRMSRWCPSRHLYRLKSA